MFRQRQRLRIIRVRNRIRIPNMVRIIEVHPKEERFLRRLLVEELVHLRRRLRARRVPVHPVQPRRKRAHVVLIEQLLRTRASRSVQMIIAPADAREVARLAQQFRKRHHIRWQRGREAAHPNCHRHASGHDRRSRWHALRRRCKHAVAAQSFTGKLIERGRPNRISVAAQVRITVVVAQHQ